MDDNKQISDQLERLIEHMFDNILEAGRVLNGDDVANPLPFTFNMSESPPELQTIQEIMFKGWEDVDPNVLLTSQNPEVRKLGQIAAKLQGQGDV